MSIAKHTAANVIGGIAPLAVALLTVPTFLHHVGAERYGVLSVLWTLLTYFALFDFGFGRATSQRLSKLSDSTDAARNDLIWTALGATAILALVAAFLLWVSAGLLLTRVVDLSPASRIEAERAVHWLIPALPVVMLGSVLRGALVGRLQFLELNVVEVITSVLTQTLPLAAALAGYTSLEVLVPVTLASRLLSACLLMWRCAVHVPIWRRPAFKVADARQLAAYGKWASLISLLIPVLVTGDRLVLASLKSAAALPSYTIPFDLVTKVLIITAAVSGALFPRLAAAAHKEASEMASQAARTIVQLMTPAMVFGVFFATPFLRLWVGEQFALTSFGVPETLLVGVWISTVGVAHQTRLFGTDRPRALTIVYAASVPLFFALLFAGITQWNVVGAAIAWSGRVLFETCLILVICGSFRRTFRDSAISGVLVLLSVALVTRGGLEPLTYWTSCVALTCLSLFHGRLSFASAIAAILGRRLTQGSDEALLVPCAIPGEPVQKSGATSN